jgi:hypothetical protein
MKVSQAVHYHLEYHKANSQENTQRCVEYVLRKFNVQFQERSIASVSEEDVLTFLMKLTFKRRQTTKRNRYAVLYSFYNFMINTSLPELKNPCSNSVIKKNLPSCASYPVENLGQGHHRRNNLPHDNVKKQTDAGVDGSRWYEDQRGSQPDTKRCR